MILVHRLWKYRELFLHLFIFLGRLKILPLPARYGITQHNLPLFYRLQRTFFRPNLHLPWRCLRLLFLYIHIPHNADGHLFGLLYFHSRVFLYFGNFLCKFIIWPICFLANRIWLSFYESINKFKLDLLDRYMLNLGPARFFGTFN